MATSAQVWLTNAMLILAMLGQQGVQAHMSNRSHLRCTALQVAARYMCACILLVL